MQFKRQFCAVFIGVVCVCGLLTACWHQGYRWNVSVSFPPGFYKLSTSSTPINTGDLVLFCPPNSEALQTALRREYLRPGDCPGGFQPVIKKVMATAGARVTLDQVVAINGKPVANATVRALDGAGRPLPQLQDFTVPTDSYLLLSDYAPSVSYDSRYYGSIPHNQIRGHIAPVWVFPTHKYDFHS